MESLYWRNKQKKYSLWINLTQYGVAAPVHLLAG